MCTFVARLLALFLSFLSTASYAQLVLSGTAEIQQALRRLNVLGSVLMIAAHPDDENTALLAYYARGRHVRTAYLSATRGEGGQNLIGPEQGDLLGVIRTQELLAARRLDGAEQLFTRAIDFGFSKSAEETLQKWGREETLSDIVWVIRRFRPDVIVLRFSGTARDGHGQHQASAILGKQAFFAAADAKHFPEQLKFVSPWQAKRMLFNVFSFTSEQERAAAQTPDRLEVDAGEFNPVLGRSYTEIAGMSRSMHRSQGMGSPERRGPFRNYLVHVAGERATQDVFEGIDTSWNRVAGGAEAGKHLAAAIAAFQPEHPERIIPHLLAARRVISALHDPASRGKLPELDEAISLCAGLWLDAAADRYAAIPSQAIQVRLTALNRSRAAITQARVRIEGMGAPAEIELPAPLIYNQPANAGVSIPVPADQPYSQPFWLAAPKRGQAYGFQDLEWIGVADAPPVLRAVFQITIGGTPIELRRRVQYRYVDRVEGERTGPLIVVPPVAVQLPPTVLLFPNAGSRKLLVQVQSNLPGASGYLRLELDRGWSAQPPRRDFRLSSAGEQQDLAFEIKPPAAESTGHLRAVAEVGGREISSGMKVIAYPHIPAQAVFPGAFGKMVRADVQVLAKKIGYVMGAGDEVPEALRQLGCEVTLLAPADVEQRDLAEFDAIVTGVRAYNVRADLRANQHRLLEYVKGGGTLIVQYNVLEGGSLPALGPYPMTIGRGRVSVEEAPVTFRDPGHPLLQHPNVIAPRDFAGWVQERGLYFASQWDPRYESVLESHDPGEPPLAGGMLYARYGKGVYIFSAYSWFRQLPAGVPGAYRLFANMLSAK